MVLRAVLVALGSLSAGVLCSAQEPQAPQDVPDAEERSIEDLGLVGAAVTMPGFSDTVLGTDSGFRRALSRRGMAFRVNVVPRYTQNLFDGPAPAGEQVYIGHRPTLISGVNPIFTWDLRQLGLHQAQLNVALGWRYTTWQPAGPTTVCERGTCATARATRAGSLGRTRRGTTARTS